MRGSIFQGVVRNANQAIFDFVFGHRLSIRRGGRLYTLRHTGSLFAIGRCTGDTPNHASGYQADHVRRFRDRLQDL